MAEPTPIALLKRENAALREQLERHQRIGAVRGEVFIGQIVDGVIQLTFAAEHGNQQAKALLEQLHGALELSRAQASGLSIVRGPGS